MTMSPSVRRAALVAHVSSSVGWLGAVVVFLALAICGSWGKDVQVARAAYLAMRVITWWVIVPLSVASLVTGLVTSLGTPWGLFRHYWVVVKLSLTVVATGLLLLHTRPIDHVAAIAADPTVALAAAGRLRFQLVADAAAAVVLLLTTTVLSVFKPRGVTRYGRRQSSS
jgi:hypothetical protein